MTSAWTWSRKAPRPIPTRSSSTRWAANTRRASPSASPWTRTRRCVCSRKCGWKRRASAYLLPLSSRKGSLAKRAGVPHRRAYAGLDPDQWALLDHHERWHAAFDPERLRHRGHWARSCRSQNEQTTRLSQESRMTRHLFYAIDPHRHRSVPRLIGRSSDSRTMRGSRRKLPRHMRRLHRRGR